MNSRLQFSFKTVYVIHIVINVVLDKLLNLLITLAMDSMPFKDEEFIIVEGFKKRKNNKHRL